MTIKAVAYADTEQTRAMQARIKRLRAVADHARTVFEALDGKALEDISAGLTWHVDWLGKAIENCADHGDLEEGA